mmetsp:Transcript_5691/g.22324  ORF Transcript_5691/g.22324 Transcript_5691/m.22324 type:complete len:217 (+) Transcript_5691:1050-1700(+)
MYIGPRTILFVRYSPQHILPVVSEALRGEPKDGWMVIDHPQYDVVQVRRVRAVVEQNPANLRVALFSRRDDRRFSAMVGLVHGGATVQQQLHRGLEAFPSGAAKRRVSVAIDRVDIHSAIQEESGHLRVIHHMVQQRDSGDAGLVQLGAAVQQKSRRPCVASYRGVAQRRPAIAGHLIHIRTAVQQERHHVLVLVRCKVEGGVSRIVGLIRLGAAL